LSEIKSALLADVLRGAWRRFGLADLFIRQTPKRVEIREILPQFACLHGGTILIQIKNGPSC
jgi:hypothetical protein